MANKSVQIYDSGSKSYIAVQLVDLGGGVYALGTSGVSGGGGAVTLAAGANIVGKVGLVNGSNTELFTTATPGAVAPGTGYLDDALGAVVGAGTWGSRDVSAYVWVSVQVVANSGTVTWQVSNDNATWVGIALDGSNSTQAGPALSTASTGLWQGSLGGAKYFQVTTTGNATLYLHYKSVAGMVPTVGATVQLTPSTSSGNGATPYRVSSLASNNAVVIKSSAGNVFTYDISNTNATARYVKLYNKASAPSPATDNALLIDVIQVPGNGSRTANPGTNGLGFSSGIAIAIVTGASDIDNTAVGAGDVLVTLGYK